MLHTSDKEFIVSTITTIVSKENEKMKDFVIEHVSNEINDLAYTTVNGFKMVDERFEQVDKKINVLENNMNSKFEGVYRRMDDLALNRVKNEVYERLEKRVAKLELKVAK